MDMTEDNDFGVGSLPQVKKINAIIPAKLYSELQARALLDESWDNWLAEAILQKLRDIDNRED